MSSRRLVELSPVQTFYRWRKEYGGLKMDQAKRLKELEKKRQVEAAGGGAVVERSAAPPELLRDTAITTGS
jgi:hypothetical protein